MRNRQAKSRPRLRMLGNLLMAVGILLILGVGSSYAYSYYLEQQARSDPWLTELQATWERESPGPSPGLAAASPEAEESVAPPAPTPAPSPTARAYPPPVGIRIPSIAVESRVVEVGVADGQYEVPKFYVGHYGGTAHPGQQGNGIYAGHLESISSGNVFADLPKIEVGQEVFLYTEERSWRYEVAETKTVRNDEVSVMAPTDDDRITLITCTGTWDPATQQYTHRFIAIAVPGE